MFNREPVYSTKELYLAEIKSVTKIKFYGISNYEVFYSDSSRYALVRHKENEGYFDIFTGTKYKKRSNVGCDSQGEECMYNKHAIITDVEYLTKDEVTYILEHYNPTYIHKEVTKDDVLKSRKR